MEQKGAVRYDGARVAPLLSLYPKRYYEGRNGKLLEKVYEGSLGLMVASMAGQKALSKEDIDELYPFCATRKESWKMTELVITSSVLISAVIILRFLFRSKISRRARYSLWAVVLLRLLLPFSLFESPSA
jgi:hypothetical protein